MRTIATLCFAVHVDQLPSLAFIDVETTGVNPAVNRITEIGVVSVSAGGIEQWSTLVHTAKRATSIGDTADDEVQAPRFRNVAPGLAQRLSGCLLIAHNARFDYGFLKAEFGRVGIEFRSQVLCSVMLSRKMYPHFARHDLDSLVARHRLMAGTRHRALPDADLIWQWWQVLHRDHPQQSIAETISDLLQGPILPAQLDPSLIDRLPESPGAYVLYGECDEPLLVGAATNLRLRVLNYFRIDLASAKALALSLRVTNITWRVTQGSLGARLHAASLEKKLFTRRARNANLAALTWQLMPDKFPGVALTSLSELQAPRACESFGMYSTERKARNALLRLATKHRLCHSLLGIAESAGTTCLACSEVTAGPACVRRIDRIKQLARLFVAIRRLRLPMWPYGGAMGIRERSDLHIFDNWRYLGTAKCSDDIYAVLETRRQEFDNDVFALLAKHLSRLPRCRMVSLPANDTRTSTSGEFA